MGLISWQEFWNARESSAATRSKTAAALGLGPDVADVFGHSTPPPWQVERLLKKLKKSNKKNKKDKDKDGDVEKDETIEENHPDYSFDRLIQKAMDASEEIDDEIDKAEEESERLEKKKKEEKKKPKIGPRLQKIEDSPKDKESPSIDVDHEEKPEKAPSVKPHDKGRNQDDADEPTEEETWLRLSGNTSFDHH